MLGWNSLVDDQARNHIDALLTEVGGGVSERGKT
jgi:hypothetical protein